MAMLPNETPDQALKRAAFLARRASLEINLARKCQTLNFFAITT